ncbi:RNA polymerase sigma factor [Terriglobus sp. TAA 43]|uniref:RNA polymerase sigma factor n=1 Tax=Terriglobus sp. TAA 43 TaxID=278961 RepID=UPI000646B3D5|nr:RNA polymerase sigma factor [Terriglobus sp. TAA 43]
MGLKGRFETGNPSLRLMVPKKTTWSAFGSLRKPDEFLERHYDRLLRWGVLLTRGDAGLAREVVHDLCVYLMLTNVDFDTVANLEGYLYTSLRHVYLSRLDQASRETLRFVSVADFDSVQFALLGNDRNGSLAIQNELRAICSYAVWRKDASKSFSYFILHFFLGYFPREIGELAILPVAAIYNKLKSARTELGAHLSAIDKVHSIDQSSKPIPPESVVSVAVMEFFAELRAMIAEARKGECLPEAALLDLYSQDPSSPIPCDLLSHMVSCERCLNVIDRHFQRPTLIDRDTLDGFDRGLNMQGPAPRIDDNTFEIMRRHKERIFHHRPQALFIAVNGRVLAFHDVHGTESTLAARLDYSERPDFVEVFSEQQVRLALISIGDAPPSGPSTLSQSISLSERRRLNLKITFDGLGIHGEAIYFDPDAFPVHLELSEGANAPAITPTQNLGRRLSVKELLSTLFPSPVGAWILATVLVLATGAYLIHHVGVARVDGNAVLDQAVQAEAMAMVEATKHQTLVLEETSSNGQQLKGVVEVWQQNGRSMRRLYDTHHHLLASAWNSRDGHADESTAPEGAIVDHAARQLLENDLWKRDVSPQSFRSLVGKTVQAATDADGYTLSASFGPQLEGHVDSGVLVLDKHFKVVREELHLGSTSPIRSAKFVLLTQEFEPSSQVLDNVFSEQKSQGGSTDVPGRTASERQSSTTSETKLVQLQVETLYAMTKMQADIGEPLQILRTPDGRLLVSGVLSSESRRAEIVSRLKTLPEQQLLIVNLNTQGQYDANASSLPRSKALPVSVYSVTGAEPPADALIKRYFSTSGRSNDDQKMAASQFSRDVLENAQRALQHAYALDRLKTDFTMTELRLAGPIYQQQWAEMAATHAVELQDQLSALETQLATIAPYNKGPELLIDAGTAPIDNPMMFAHTVSQLLRKTQELNRTIGLAFTSNAAQTSGQNAVDLLAHARASVPMEEVTRAADFAQQLSMSQAPHAGKNNRGSSLPSPGNP